MRKDEPIYAKRGASPLTRKAQPPAEAEPDEGGEIGSGKDVSTIIWRAEETMPEVRPYLTPAEEAVIGKRQEKEQEEEPT